MEALKVRIFDELGTDRGYLQNQQNWWFEPGFPHAFELFDLDSFYEENYFKNDHVGADTVKRYADAVLTYGQQLIRAPVLSILEAGCGGGWFTKEFYDRGIDIVAIEGTRVGVDKAIQRGVPPQRITHHDLRRPLQIGRRFQIAVCTEVAEHIECPFAAQLIQTLVDHSDIIWFSFEPPGGNEAHYHHCNEQPLKFWSNLFNFHGYARIELPSQLSDALESRGKYIFCSSHVSIPADLVKRTIESSPTDSLGLQMRREPRIKYWFKKITPPIAIDAARWAFRQR
jgi:hypothetical protein